jgi:hypothetical protein
MKREEREQLVKDMIAEISKGSESVALTRLVGAIIAEGPEAVAQAQRVIAYILEKHFPETQAHANSPSQLPRM